MTAIVGVLNKRAAVMAADSAVTVTTDHGTKIYNTATKIFSLSKEHPIGAMIFSASSFMDTPWDLIFKLYRNRNGSQAFNTLEEYVQNFLHFLASEDYFSSENSRKRYLKKELQSIYDFVDDYAQDRFDDVLGDDKPSDEKTCDILRQLVKEALDNIVVDAAKEAGKCSEFEGYTLSQLRSYAKETFDSFAGFCENDGYPADLRDLWEEAFFEYISSRQFRSGTGLVFVGYGEKDIYPRLITIYISGAFDRRLRYSYAGEEECVTIDNDNNSTILPFAQSDVMLNLMKGIHPDFKQFVKKKHRESMEKVREKVLSMMEEAGCAKKLLKAVKTADLDDFQNEYEEQLEDFSQDEFVDGIVEAVNSFNIEDMVNMAESLISITNLQRHISSSEESVGGPIDVAVITRTEGFHWAKHKHLPHESIE